MPGFRCAFVLFLLRFRVYTNINRLIQRILYNYLHRYKLDLPGFFDAISEIPYIAIKTDVPYMVECFPVDYPVGKDIDLIVAEENLGTMVDHVELFARSNHGFKIRRVQERQGLRLRFEFGGVLHYQIHVSYGVTGLSSDFIAQSIAGRRKVRNFYVPELSYELVYRLVDYYEHRDKMHHLEYARRHANSIDWGLFDNPEIKQYCQALIEACE